MCAFNARSSRDIKIMTEIGQYFRDNPDLSGGTNVSEHDQLFRYRLTECLMHAGILAKADALRPLLERAGRSSVDRRHLAPYVPKVEASEIALLCDEMVGQLISWIFDTTARVGDLFCMLGRWCTSDFELVHRLVSLVTNKHHMTAQQQTALISQLILTKYRHTRATRVKMRARRDRGTQGECPGGVRGCEQQQGLSTLRA